LDPFYRNRFYLGPFLPGPTSVTVCYARWIEF